MTEENKKYFNKYLVYYKTKVIRERQRRGRIENERVGSNLCLYVCLITDRTSPIYRYNMVTHKGYKIK